jgi:hypothetical protein
LSTGGNYQIPINLFARNGDNKTPRQISKGNMSIAKIMKKAENNYINEIFDAHHIPEMQLLSYHLQSKKIHFIKNITNEDRRRHQDLSETGYQSLYDQLRVLKY